MHNYQIINDRKIRLALVGCGRISSNHFDAIDQHSDNVELVDVCDVNIDALAKAVSRTKAVGHNCLAYPGHIYGVIALRRHKMGSEPPPVSEELQR